MKCALEIGEGVLYKPPSFTNRKRLSFSLSLWKTTQHFLYFSEILREERMQQHETMRRENRRVQGMSWGKYFRMCFSVRVD